MILKHNVERLNCELPYLGFGAMRLPTNPDESIDKEHVKQMVAYAMENGVNYFDTAYMYHQGTSESVMGEVLSAYPRNSFYVATKLPVVALHEEGDQERIFAEQLARLQVDYFDFYLAHAVDKEKIATMEKLDTINFLLKMKQEGKIKHLGFSFHDDTECFKKALAMTDWDFVQLQLNYYDFALNEEAPTLHKLAVDANLPIFLMEPVRGGMLANMPEGGVEILKKANPNKSPATFALQWASELEGVSMTLSGMSNLDQLKENVATFSSKETLTDTERKAIAETGVFLVSYKTIGCTNCQYCLPCPVGIEIPQIFKIYNDYKLLKNVFFTRKNYGDIPADAKPSACIHCNQCVSACPQQLQVPDFLAMADEELSAV